VRVVSVEKHRVGAHFTDAIWNDGRVGDLDNAGGVQRAGRFEKPRQGGVTVHDHTKGVGKRLGFSGQLVGQWCAVIEHNRGQEIKEPTHVMSSRRARTVFGCAAQRCFSERQCLGGAFELQDAGGCR
jgi:hypothetical protein